MNKKGSAAALIAVLLVAAVGIGVMLKGTGVAVTGQVAADPANAQVFMAQCQQKCFQKCSSVNLRGRQFAECASNCKRSCAAQLQRGAAQPPMRPQPRILPMPQRMGP